MYYEKLVFLSIAGIACVWGVSFGLSLTLAIYALSITDNKVRYTPFIIYNFVWGYIMIASIISEIMRYRKCIRERPDSPRSTLMILFLRSACEVILVVLSVRFEYYDIPRGINITNDIFKIIITLLCLLNLVYIIYLFSKRGVLSGIGFLDILRENDNSKNPVPPAVDKIIGGNETTIDEINL